MKYEVRAPGIINAEFASEADAKQYARRFRGATIHRRAESYPPASTFAQNPIIESVVLNTIVDTFSDVANDNSVPDTDFSGGGGDFGGGGSSGEW